MPRENTDARADNPFYAIHGVGRPILGLNQVRNWKLENNKEAYLLDMYVG